MSRPSENVQPVAIQPAPVPKQTVKGSAFSDPVPFDPQAHTPPTGPPRSKFVIATIEYISRPTVAAFIGGGIAGAVSRTVVSPLERMKILFQVQGAGQQQYHGIWSALSKMWKEEGFKGMLRGNGTNCIRIVPYSAVQFSSYTVYRRWAIKEGETDLSPYKKLIAGAMAGVTSVVATYPLDICRTRLSIQTASLESLSAEQRSKIRPPGMWSTMRSMYVNEGGFVALYRGLIPTLAGVAPYVGLNFAVYESIRAWMTPEGQTNPSPLRKLASGAMSGAIAQTLTYPFDLLRRRFQVNTMSGLGYKYKSIWHAISTIIRQEGIRGMYKGILPNLLKVAPSMASSWLSFEIVKDALVGLRRPQGY